MQWYHILTLAVGGVFILVPVAFVLGVLVFAGIYQAVRPVPPGRGETPQQEGDPSVSVLR